MSSLLLPPPRPLPPPAPPVVTRPLWHRSPSSSYAGFVLRSSDFQPSSVSLSTTAAASLRAVLRAQAIHEASGERVVRVSAELTAGAGTALDIHIHSATETRQEVRRAEYGATAGAEVDDDVLAAGDDSSHFHIAVKCGHPPRAPHTSGAAQYLTSHWTADVYSAELSALTRRMDRHRLQPAMQHYIRAFGALLDDSFQQSLHIECLSPSLSLHLTLLLPSAIALQPSPWLHSLLSHSSALRSFASTASFPASGYLSGTVGQQVRLVSLQSEVLSLPLLGVYSTEPPHSLTTFVQCVHFLYSRSINRLTVAPLTFLLLSVHNQRAELYEVCAVMDEVAIEHCEADIALPTASSHNLTAPLRSLSIDRMRQVWGDTAGLEDSGHPSMGASTATTETDSAAADNGSSGATYVRREGATWQGVYSDGETELGDGHWPTSPMSLRSPSPLSASPPRPQPKRTQQPQTPAQHNSRPQLTRKQRAGRMGPSAARAALQSVDGNRIAARSAAAVAVHQSRAKSAVTIRPDEQTAAETKKRRLQAVSARMRERKATQVAARKRLSAAAAAAAETRCGVSTTPTVQQSDEQHFMRHVADAADGHRKMNRDIDTLPSPSVAQTLQACADSSRHHSQRHSAVEHTSLQRSSRVRAAVVRVDDTRSECETEERRKDIQRRRTERMQQQRQQLVTRQSSGLQQSSSSQPDTAIVHSSLTVPTIAMQQPPLAVSAASLTPAQPGELLSLLLSTSLDPTCAPTHSATNSASQASLSAWQLLRLLVHAAHQRHPLSMSETTRAMVATNEWQPVSTAQPTTAGHSIPPSDQPRSEEASHTGVEAAQRLPTLVETKTARAVHSTRENVGPFDAIPSDGHTPSLPQALAVQDEADGTRQHEAEASLDVHQQHVSVSGLTTGDQREDAGCEVEHAEETYPITLQAQRRDDSQSDTEKELNASLQPTEPRPGHSYQLGGQPQPLSLSAASIRSPSPSHSPSNCSDCSDLEHAEESSWSEWPAAALYLSPRSTAPCSLSVCTSTTPSLLSLPPGGASSPASRSSLRCVESLVIPRIDATAVSTNRRSQSVDLHSSEDDDDEDDEETLLNKYDDDSVRSSHARLAETGIGRSLRAASRLRLLHS